MEETAPLNGTTIKDQAWKEKKGFGPMVLLSLLLFVSVATAAVLYSNESSSDFVVGGDDRGGLNGAILRGSNVHDVVEIVASSSNVEADVTVDVGNVFVLEDTVSVCPTSGSITVFTVKELPVTPGVIYSNLDFSTKSYNQHHFKFDGRAPWRRCAERCNNDKRCRTFSVHLLTGNAGNCYLHSDWVCNGGSKYETGDHMIFSGVCRPEAGWNNAEFWDAQTCGSERCPC